MSNSIFTITTVSKTCITRCWGFAFSYQDAINEMRRNAALIYECGEGEYVVIEEIQSGIYSNGDCNNKEYWYQLISLDVPIDTYISIDKPVFAEQLVKFAMG